MVKKILRLTFMFLIFSVFVSVLSACSKNRTISDAQELLAQRRYEEALQIYDQLLKAETDPARVYFGRANALMGMRRFTEAINDYSEAISYGKSADLLSSRCVAHRILTEYEMALTDCSEAISYEPENINALMAIAVLYLEQGNYDQANDSIQKIIKVYPNRL